MHGIGWFERRWPALTLGGTVEYRDVAAAVSELRAVLGVGRAASGALVDIRALKPLGIHAKALVPDIFDAFAQFGRVERLAVVHAGLMAVFPFRAAVRERGGAASTLFVDAAAGAPWEREAAAWLAGEAAPAAAPLRLGAGGRA